MSTKSERLAPIETLIEGIAASMEKAETERLRVHVEMRAEIAKLHADKADLAALKNKGTGLLIGVGLVGGTIDAAIVKAWAALIGS